MRHLIYFPVALLLIFTASCEQKTEYERLVQRELDSGVRHDSLFLGYYLGMERQDFLDHSWELNQQNIVTGDAQVQYKLRDLSDTANMKFYPDFKNDKIYRMPVEVHFESWAIWNREFHSDSLITQLIDKYEDDYGPGFIHTIHPELGKESWIKVDGNRRISIYRQDDMKARIEFLDLTAE
ncbi:MAG: hypothetical protein WEA56_09465 [Balneolaceae bacterium]